MSNLITIPITFRKEDLVYVREVAAIDGVSIDCLVARFVDEGMKRLAMQDNFNEVVEEIVVGLAKQAARTERELDLNRLVKNRRKQR